MIISKYDVEKYDFQAIISKMLVCDRASLNKIHDRLKKSYELFNVDTDQSSIYHEMFYEKMQSQNKFLKTYTTFVEKVIRPQYQESILYQKTPTFRISLPDNLAVGEFHKDSDYSHSKLEINYFVPITKSFDTNTIWIETEIGSNKFNASNMNYGEILKFDGANLLHGNKINKTGKSRISFDFRVLKKSDYDKDNSLIKKSITQNKSMTIGEYWELIC